MAHHEPFKALAPIDWATIPHDDLTEFLITTFASAQTLIDSIPVPPSTSPTAAKTGRARAHTESEVRASSSSHVELNRALAGREHSNSSPSAAWASKLEKEWKEIKMNPKENPLSISVYKLSAKDGKGAWFARRSIHDGFTFEKFKLGLEREFAEALKINEGPGSGAVRGIGAEKKAEQESCPGVGKIEVYQLSAQFPGPTTPRDFVTLLLSSDAGAGVVEKGKTGKLPRQFMVVSKPCNHPDCAPRSGYIRGQYESVEIIREIPVEKPLRRTRSSINLSRDEVKVKEDGNVDISKEAMLRSARKAAEASANEDGHKRSISLTSSMTMPSESGENADDTETAIEWLMITRSDPGGSVPRFMVEKGTPGGIVSDAGRFLKWLSSKDPRDFDEADDNDFKEQAIKSEETQPDKASKPLSHEERSLSTSALDKEDITSAAEASAPSGFYGILANALGVAGSMVATRLPISFSGSARGSEVGGSSDIDSSDTSSERSFVSAEGQEMDEKLETTQATEAGGVDDTTSEVASKHSGRSDESHAVSATASQHEKELKKLQERRRKIEEKMAKTQEQKMAKKGDDSEAAAAKLREKHEKELAKQEERYQRELKKLEENRKKEEKKAEERRRKQIEREEKNNIGMELERVKIERDMALKQIDILKDQVGELQSQNTMLVAKLGKLGALGKE